MTSHDLSMAYIVPRSIEKRRAARNQAPPYMTDEGMVLFDRRSGEERRTCGSSENEASQMVQIDLPQQ